MLRRTTAGLVVLVLTLCACAPKVDVAAETAALRARSEAMVAAEQRMAIDEALALYHPDAVILPSGAPSIRGRDAVREMYQGYFGSGMVKSFEASITHLEVAASGDIGYEYGVNRFTLNTPDGEMLDVGKYLAIWKKVDGEWYAAVLSFNSDAAAPTPVAPTGR